MLSLSFYDNDNGITNNEPGRRRHSTRGSIGGGDREVIGVTEAESLMSSSVGCLASG